MREQMPVIPAGRPAAMCGSAPTVMPTAATAMTSRADCAATPCPGRASSSAYDIAPTMRDRRRLAAARQREPQQFAERDEAAECQGGRPVDRLCARSAVGRSPCRRTRLSPASPPPPSAAAGRSPAPASTRSGRAAGQAPGHRCRPSRNHDLKRRCRVVVVLDGHDRQVGRRAGRGRQRPLLDVERGDEGLDDQRVELRAGATGAARRSPGRCSWPRGRTG